MSSVSTVLGNVLAFLSVVGIVVSINPAYLIFLAPVLFVFAVELLKSRVLYKRDYKMAHNNRIKAYAQRTVFLRDFSKDMRTSGVFSVVMNRFNKAIQSNIDIIKNYGLKLFAFSMVSAILGELIPIAGTYAFAGYQFIYTDALSVAGFSVVLSSINSVRAATFNIAQSFSQFSSVALYFQNLHDFFDYESSVVSGEKQPDDLKALNLKTFISNILPRKIILCKTLILKSQKGKRLPLSA